ncbi:MULTISPECIES: aminomethyl-transferring glycine dehydrogenase [Flavobacteriaceae]|uniref:glycine dehydrogenase (aminomethyl-transferring) n=2 Tax=Flavobacteriaceae TaxID=49546 RepID=A0A4Y8AP12_9FLAO|nr:MULTISPECIES: aminomethyl-transferring glycine dehydrogenase [Flavobacteriaceae]TEW72160.1 aminomethyl-transferring glycine dehydrogenase [Gramella jeungdoensis]GGK56877.1 glycine dehydrogenase (aminomethyl-transferring) [Lutibacter litoralis]
MRTDSFVLRHVGPRENEIDDMVKTIGVTSVDELIDKTIPADIRLANNLNLPKAMSEYEYMFHIQELATKNKMFKNYIGLGYHPTILPGVIQRNVLENPGWYTAYTPYQAEIAQGRLEALLNYQTMVSELTGMELANASLLDEGTAAGEAMLMLLNTRSRDKKKANALKFFVSDEVLPQTIDVLKTRANPLEIELVFGDHTTFEFTEEFYGGIIQYPAKNGQIYNYTSFVKKATNVDAKIVVAADLLSLSLLTPPGEWGADVVIGTTQRFGIPMGYGGPHAGYFATKETYKRNIPGRIIGVTQDKDGNRALRMALQTREQHIKREKATSNICTAQVLLAVMAGMYGVFHGPKGLTYIANKIQNLTATLNKGLATLNIKQQNSVFFDTLLVEVSSASKVKEVAEKNCVNFYYPSSKTISISINETSSIEDINQILEILAEAEGKQSISINTIEENSLPRNLERTSKFMINEVFEDYHSETELMRYIKKLERKDLSLNHSMISLGSCTMKLNAATEMLPLSWPNWGVMHPFVPIEQAQGYQEVIKGLEIALNEITGFYATSLQPNSGASGEYAGLLVIKAYHESRGENHRNICIIPASAHGTNPASAVMAGMKVVVTKSTEKGNIDLDDLREKANLHKNNLAALMVTYPSTHGVFESTIKEITDIIHERGGQVYMDGANMNAQVGLTNPATIGADVCHLNLHKTFAIPHGGGGPGVGPICVVKHLAPFLPSNPIIPTGGKTPITAISSAPWGSALVLLISYSYIKMLGTGGLKEATIKAILNANYIKARLEKQYDILYTGENGFAAHEMIVDFRKFKEKGIEVTDVAKRLMDYGYHAPTVSFPVAGTLMIEPTESENKAELDRFCDALISIKSEIDAMESGDTNSALKNSPHTQEMLTADEWNYPYTRQQAAFPLPYVKENKFWPSVRRVDDAYGDRNLICSCNPIEDYMD